MSDERELSNYNSAVSKKGSELLKEKFAGMSKDDIRRRNVRIVSRGSTIAATTVSNLPKELHGEWVHVNDVDEYLGIDYVLDNEFAGSTHGDGTSVKRVGDVVHMITTQENYQAIEESKRLRSEAMQDPRKHVAGDVAHLQNELGAKNVEDPNISSQQVGMDHIKTVVDNMNNGDESNSE